MLGKNETWAYLDGVEVEAGFLFELVLQVGDLGPRLDQFFAQADHV